jgi:plastocyanin
MFVFTTAAALVLAAPALAAEVRVQIAQSAFVPASVTIQPGDRVVWTNTDTVDRQFAADRGAFRSPLIRPGQTYSFTFAREGTFAYTDAQKPTVKGTVIVEAEPEPSVTIQPSRRQIVYGSTVQLSGTISTGQEGQAVRVTGTPYRGDALATTVRTDADGVWRLTVRPQLRTVYRAFWRGQESTTEPVVHVRPRVGFRVLSTATARFYVRVSAAYSYRGKLVNFQRLAAGGDWITVKRVRLGRLSDAAFRGPLPRGTSRVRVSVPTSPGYLLGLSNVRLVRR